TAAAARRKFRRSTRRPAWPDDVGLAGTFCPLAARTHRLRQLELYESIRIVGQDGALLLLTQSGALFGNHGPAAIALEVTVRSAAARPIRPVGAIHDLARADRLDQLLQPLGGVIGGRRDIARAIGVLVDE